MARYAALLRGINVGGNKKVPMADLRALLEGLGYTGVRTLLVSGNAVFTSPARSAAKVAGRIEAAIVERFAMSVSCVVLTRDELQAVVDAHPLADVATDGSRMMAFFLAPAPDPALLAAHDPTALDPERSRLGDRVIYQWCPGGLMEAPDIGSYAHKKLGVTVTGRNWNTVTKLLALL